MPTFTLAISCLLLKKVGETIRPFRYDLNQIPYDYTMVVRNRFKGLDLIDSASRTMDRGSWHCTGGSDQNYVYKAKYIELPIEG